MVAAERKDLHGAIVLCPPSSIQDLWSRKFPDPVTAFASGWMRVRARARQKGVELPLVISDHRTGRISAAPSATPVPGKSGSPTGRRTRWCIGAARKASAPSRCISSGMATTARPSPIRERTPPWRRPRRERFRRLLDRLAYEPRRNAKLRLLQDFFAATPDPERGWALAAMTGGLTFREAKPALIRGLVEERVDPVLFGLSHNYVGDLAETTALIWPGPDARPGSPGIGHNNPPPHIPTLAEVVETLATTPKRTLPQHLAGWLDALDETGRWALLKLVTGNLRVGVSARLAKTAVGALGGHEADAVEQVWHGLKAPYAELFAWVEGRGEQPENRNPAPFRPPMLSHPIEEEADLDKLDPEAFSAEWKWDGIRVQLAGGRDAQGQQVGKVYSRTGEDITDAFPDLAEAITFTGAIDGELLILRERRVQSFNVLQQRLNRKAVTGKLLAEFPAHVRAYDLLAAEGEDLRALPFAERRAGSRPW